ncbi:hypothetical protein QFC24_002462 [Naganishia onofrii]|uniref:Uncharacterized protein n=1 Tax=Naganishia onofrii TaxID=1851511 RepID=A0ACC2XQ58_9TREE|nr:hypothetical protein QFC24_002462 [Naganishia onofrii]
MKSVLAAIKSEDSSRDSSPDSLPPSAHLKPVSVKQQPESRLSLQVPITNGQGASQQSASPVATPFSARAASVTSISSSVVRQSPAPSPTPAPGPEQIQDRERRLKETQDRLFPSPPPSDDESFIVPIRQPFKPTYAEEVNVEQRKNYTPIGLRAPDMEWTRSLLETEVTPPDSPSSNSSASSEDVLMDMGNDLEYVEELDGIASSRPRQTAQSSSTANSKTPAGAGTSERPSKVGKRSTKEIGSAKGERLAAEQSSRTPKEPAQQKPWELRRFVAPELKELRETTLTSKEIIPFSDIRKLLPPVITGLDSKQLESSFVQLRRLLIPSDAKMADRPRVELSLLQVAWVVNQIAEHGSARYLKAFAADVSNMKLLEFFLNDAYARGGKSIINDKDYRNKTPKTKLTEWRATCVAYFTIKVGISSFPDRDISVRILIDGYMA